jgi:hypothetical protein
MKKIIACLLLIAPFFMYGQVIKFEKGFNCIIPYYGSAIKLSSGGYAVAGADNNNAFLLRLNLAGDTLLSKIYHFDYPSPGTGHVSSIESSDDNGNFIFGSTSIFNNDSYFIGKNDALGNIEWIRRFYYSTQTSFRNKVKTSDGGFLIGGDTYNGVTMYFISKHDSSGNPLWAKIINEDSLYIIGTEEIDNKYYILTEKYSTWEYKILKIDEDGNFLGAFEISSLQFLGSNSYGDGLLKKSFDHDLILLSDISDSTGNRRILFTKIDTTGNIILTKTYKAGGVYPSRIIQTTDSGFAFLSTSTCGPSVYNFLLIRTDENGDTLWTKSYSHGETENWCSDMEETADGGFIITGFNADEQLYLIKTDSLGKSGCEHSCGFFISSTVVLNSSQISMNFTGITMNEGGLSISESSGCTSQTYCSNVSVNELKDANTFDIYPNPVSSYENAINISLNKDIRNGVIDIFNRMGEKIHSEIFNGKQKTINYSLVEGMYLLRVTSEKEMWTGKIIKE